MKRDHAYLDDLDYDDELLHPSMIGRLARQRRGSNDGPTVRRKPAHRDDLVEPVGDDELVTTYTPARYEKVWLQESLSTFFEQQLISDVLAQIRGGKEANVYRCLAYPAANGWLAAKVYRPRQFRNLSNDKMYREGRAILTAAGSPVKETDHRVMRALGKKTVFGEQVRHTSWLMHEYTTLERLHRAGAAVPQPLAVGDNAMLMSYHGDAHMAAPTLNGVTLTREEAASLFGEVMRNVELMLEHGLIHGDLSAYNILYWEGAITIIDFPQVTQLASNSNALAILGRDVTRVCQYFAGQGVACEPERITAELWARYGAIDPDDLAADLSALPDNPVPKG